MYEKVNLMYFKVINLSLYIGCGIVCGRGVRLRWQCRCMVVIGSDVELCNIENMTKIRSFTNVTFLLVVITSCAITKCTAVLSDKQLCYDPNCSGNWSHTLALNTYKTYFSTILEYAFVIMLFFLHYIEPVSLAKTILAYNANDREVLSFSKFAEVTVFSKSAGKRRDLWGVEVYFVIFLSISCCIFLLYIFIIYTIYQIVSHWSFELISLFVLKLYFIY